MAKENDGQNLTQEEAKREYDDIQAEIAREKGIKPEPKEEEKPEEPSPEKKDEEPVEAEEDEDKSQKDESKDESEKSEEDDDESVGSKRKPNSRMVPVSRFQDFKSKTREEIEARDQKIADLTVELEKAKTVTSMKGKIKDLAEKHGWTEDAVADFINAAKESSQLDPATVETLKKAEALTKKQEAIAAFDTEFADLLEEIPEAASQKEALRKKAYEEGNLSKSLFEIYHRQVKPNQVVKKKGGETSRGGQNRSTETGPDFAKIAKDVQNNVPNAMKDLTPDQQDQFFDYLSKQGSRYSRKSK